MTSATRCSGFAPGPVGAEAVGQADDLQAGRGGLQERLVGVADDTQHRTTPGDERQHAARNLALEGRGVQMALARDDQVGRREAGRQPGHGGHQVETGHEARPQGGEAPGQPAGGPRARDGVDVDAEVPPVAVGQGAEAVGQHTTCSGDAPFCGPKTAAASTKRVVTSQAT